MFIVSWGTLENRPDVHKEPFTRYLDLFLQKRCALFLDPQDLLEFDLSLHK